MTVATDSLDLHIGDIVVYKNHGAGTITSRETRATKTGDKEIVVITFEDGLTISLPTDLAQTALRSVANDAELNRIRRTLKADAPAEPGVWLARSRLTHAKLMAGDSIGLAEIVRDAHSREKTMKEKSSGSSLSLSERDSYKRARRLLASEIGHARGVSIDEADEWIGAQLGES